MEDWIMIMQRLYRYTYLTWSQMRKLGYDKSKKTFYRILKSLRERTFIKSISYKYSPREGRLEDVHFLTPKWYKYINTFTGENKKQKLKIHKWFYEDYDHRMKTIDCKIAFYENSKNTSYEVASYLQYFETAKSKWTRQRSTKISLDEFFIIPDSVIKIISDKRQWLFCLEYHKWYRIKKIENQIKQYVKAIAKGAPSYTFWINSNVTVLLVFEKESTMIGVVERIWSDAYYQNFNEIFLFKTYEDFIKNPLCHRRNLRNKKIHLLNFLR